MLIGGSTPVPAYGAHAAGFGYGGPAVGFGYGGPAAGFGYRGPAAGFSYGGPVPAGFGYGGPAPGGFGYTTPQFVMNPPTFGSFGQLLTSASAGALYQPSWGYSTQLNLEYSTQNTGAQLNSREDLGTGQETVEHNSTQNVLVLESINSESEGYEAGEESDSEPEGHESESEPEGHQSPLQSESEPINSEFPCQESEVVDIDDNIAADRFRGIECSDYEEGPRGIDDTALYETEVEIDDAVDENVVEEEIHEDCRLENDTEVEGGDGENENEIEEAMDEDCLLGGCGCSVPELAQEISAEYLEQKRRGYKQRNRSKSKNAAVDCRKPRDVGAIEIAMKLSGKRGAEPIFEPVLGMVFDSTDEGYQFYNMYSWECGFGIVKNRLRRRQSDLEYQTMQELCCERSGIDKRVNGSTKKILCPARMKMLRGHDGGWYVSEFVKQHNHPFAASCSEKRDWFSHNRLDDYTMGIVKSLREYNVNQTTVRCVVGSMCGGLKSSSCTKRGLRAISNKISRDRMDNDVAKTMELFKKMKAEDPEFQWSMEPVANGRINTLMWCSGRSREQYACFGDVVTFDTTYCTNAYKMPFGLFVGVNNHFQTVIFGGVLMRSETTQSFEWVFKEFIELMGGKPPKTVLTDQCKAMTIALGNVWPDTFHLWCKWHVLKKIREKLGPTYTKDAKFRSEFYALIDEMMTKEEFESAWNDLCARYNLTENPFMIRTFQCRAKWAKPWAKGNFCAGMTSTQRSESANWMLKRYVPRNSSMNHFVSQFNMLLEDRELEEGREENLTKQLFVRYSRLWPVERHAVKVYTRQSLKLFRKQVDLAANFRVSKKGPDYYIVDRNGKEAFPEWRKKSYKVYVYGNGERYCCECGYFEHIGILCCHTLRVMIRLEKEEIPEIHLLTRWSRNAKDVIPHHMRFSGEKDPMTGAISHWQQRMNMKALEATSKGNTYRETYDIVVKHLNSAIREVDEYIVERKKKEEMEETEASERELETGVQNANKKNKYGASGSSAGMSDPEIQNLRGPEIVKKSGRPRTKRYLSSSEKGNKGKAKRVCVAKKPNQQNTTVVGSPATPKGKAVKTRQTKKKAQKIRELQEDPQNRGLPFQSSFCTKCRKTGHTIKKCKQVEDLNDVVCAKCDLEGHHESECLVVDEDSNGYFR